MEFYKGTKQQCDSYNQAVVNAEQYQKGDNWFTPVEREGFFYVAKHPDHSNQEMQEVKKLPEITEEI